MRLYVRRGVLSGTPSLAAPIGGVVNETPFFSLPPTPACGVVTETPPLFLPPNPHVAWLLDLPVFPCPHGAWFLIPFLYPPTCAHIRRACWSTLPCPAHAGLGFWYSFLSHPHICPYMACLLQLLVLHCPYGAWFLKYLPFPAPYAHRWLNVARTHSLTYVRTDLRIF